MNNLRTKAYSWVPSLYLGESLPFSAVMLISVIMFKELGLTDGQITFYTGWLGLPWVIKPIWSAIIDNLKTKRWWIVSMQFFMGVALALVAFTLPTSFWLQGSLVIFVLIAFASATHDISADGFYIIGLPDKRLGEIAAAIISIKEGMECSEEEINDFCHKLPRYKRPHKVIFADVPRNPTGKIEKPVLRKIYCGESVVAKQNNS